MATPTPPGLEQFMAAIRQQESGDNYSWSGEVSSTGARGAYQFEPATWDGFAKEAGVNPNDHSAQAQNQVAAFAMTQYFNKFGNWAAVAKSWYGGGGWATLNQNEQWEGGPSLNQYANLTLQHMQAAGYSEANLGSAENTAETPSTVQYAASQVGTAFATGAGVTPATNAAEANQVASTSGTDSDVYYANGQATDQSDAWAYLDQTLQQWGLGSLTNWAKGQLTNNDSADQIINDLQQTPEFEAAFPGMALRAKAGLPAMSPADYLSYADNAIQMAHQVGLPTGFMTKNEIGQLIGSDVSTTELSDRLTQAYQAVIQGPSEVRTILAKEYGVPGGAAPGANSAAQAKANGALAAYYLDPNRALPLIQNELTSAQISYTGQQAGLGLIPQSYAMMLAQEGQTESSTRSGFAQISPLQPLEHQVVGQSKQGTVGLTTLLNSQFEGSQPAQRAVQVAEETRTAGMRGGGGFVVDDKGVAGAGSANAQGVQGT